MAEYLLPFQMTQVPFPAFRTVHTSMCNTPRRYTHSCVLPVPGDLNLPPASKSTAFMVHRHAGRQNTITHKMGEKSILLNIH